MTMNWWMEIWMGSWDSMIYWHWNFQLLGGTWDTRPGRLLKEEEKFQRILPPSTNLLPQIWRSTLDILLFLIAQLSARTTFQGKPPSEYHLWTTLRIQLQNHLPRCAKWLNHHFVMVEFPPKPTRWSKVSRYPSHCVSCSRMISC